MLLSSQKGKKSKKKPTLKGKKSSSITTSVFVPASPSPSGTPPLLNANQNSTSPDARKEGSPSGASSVRFTTSTHFHRPNSESPPPSSPVPQTLQGSPGLLRQIPPPTPFPPPQSRASPPFIPCPATSSRQPWPPPQQEFAGQVMKVE